MTPRTLDPAALDRLVEWGGEKLLRQLLGLFLDGSGERRAQLAGGVAPGGDLQQTHQAAHALKSSAANLGAFEVSAVAAELEAASAAADTARSRALADALAEALDRAEVALRRRLDALP